MNRCTVLRSLAALPLMSGGALAVPGGGHSYLRG